MQKKSMNNILALYKKNISKLAQDAKNELPEFDDDLEDANVDDEENELPEEDEIETPLDVSEMSEGDKLEEELEDVDDLVDATESPVVNLTGDFWSNLKSSLQNQETGVSAYQTAASLHKASIAFQKMASSIVVKASIAEHIFQKIASELPKDVEDSLLENIKDAIREALSGPNLAQLIQEALQSASTESTITPDQPVEIILPEEDPERISMAAYYKRLTQKFAQLAADEPEDYESDGFDPLGEKTLANPELPPLQPFPNETPSVDQENSPDLANPANDFEDE